MRTSIHSAILLATVACLPLAAEDWPVPADEAAKTNPIEMSQESIEKGKTLYVQHCVDCHGATGAGDGDGAVMMGMEMRSLKDPAVTAQSDGVLFYKTAQGRNDMPGYLKDDVLTEEQIWHVVNYMRSLAADGQ